MSYLPIMRRSEVGRHNYTGTYKNHLINFSRENRNSDWYIWVYCPDGRLAYDGYWRDSAGKTIRQATLEALRGAMIVQAEKLKEYYDKPESELIP